MSHSQWNNDEWVSCVHYGQLWLILDCVIPPSNAFQLDKPKCHLLALVTSKIEGFDGAIAPVSYYATSSSQPPSTHIINLNTMCRSIGRFKYGALQTCWAIIDHSTDQVRPVFSDEN